MYIYIYVIIIRKNSITVNSKQMQYKYKCNPGTTSIYKLLLLRVCIPMMLLVKHIPPVAATVGCLPPLCKCPPALRLRFLCTSG